MNDLELLQQLWQNRAHGSVDRHGAQAAADNQKHRLVRGKTAEGKPCLTAAGKQLRPDGRTGEHGFSFRKMLHRLREIAAHSAGTGEGKSVGKAGGHVRFMDDHRDLQRLCRNHDRHGNKPALGEHNVRLQPVQDPARLGKASDHPGRIGEILPVEIPAQLARRDAVVRNSLGLDQVLLDPLVGADVMDLIATFTQLAEECNIRSDMAGRAAAGQYDFFLFHLWFVFRPCRKPEILSILLGARRFMK